MKSLLYNFVGGGLFLLFALFFFDVTQVFAQVTVGGPFNNPLSQNTVDGVLAQILFAVQAIVAALSLLFLVVGAVLYITSAGNPGRIELAKNAIWAAIIGLALALAAPSLLKEIYTVLGGNSNVTQTPEMVAAPTLSAIVLATLKALLSFVGILAIIMLVVGGILYMVASGDEGKVETAKKTILYAIIGLVVALVSLVIVKQIAAIFGVT